MGLVAMGLVACQEGLCGVQLVGWLIGGKIAVC